MPTLPAFLDLSVAINLVRYAVAAYAAGATILTTACLALQFVTSLDRRALKRPRSSRPIFLPLETAPSPSPSQ